MAMVGTKSGLNVLAPKAAQSSSASLVRGNAKPSPASSSSSSPFETFLSNKRSSEEKTSRLQRADDRNDQNETQANWPGQPKSEFAEKSPARMDVAPVGEARGNVNRPEVQTPDAQSRVEKRELDESVDNLQHRQALQGLLKKMKDEFGLDAEQVVQAFAALNPQELAQPPEASLEKLIQSLPLSPEQQGQAKLYFQQMLKDTASTDMAGYLKTSQRQLSLEVISRKEARDREIQRAVEQMQSDFFTQPQPVQPQQQLAPVAMGKYKAQQAGTSAQAQKSAAAPIPFMVNNMPGSSPTAEPVDAAFPEVAQPPNLPADLKAVAPKVAPKLEMSKGQAVPLEEAVATEVVASKEMAELPDMFEKDISDMLQALDIPQADLTKASVATAPAETAAAPAPQIAIASGMNMNQNSSSSRDDDKGRKEQPDSWNPPVNQAGGQKLQQTNAQKPESFIVDTKPTPIETAKNVKEVINRVQFLAGKGGGEMKVTMSPEGLGEVTMKVAIQKGQVNVEMITESKEVKKLLEHGLGELKATLLANNLKVDQIRVDTPADVSRQLTQNHDEAQRQFAQQFMEQFRQDNNEWRRGFYDIPGAKSSAGQKEEAERGPTVNSSDRRRTGSRRLDLVA